MTALILLSWWAIPPASVARLSSFWALRLRACIAFSAVMSRATDAIPMTFPFASRIAESVSDTLIKVPSLRLRVVTKCSTRSPRPRLSRIKQPGLQARGESRAMSAVPRSRRRYNHIFLRSLVPDRDSSIPVQSTIVVEDSTSVASRRLLSSARLRSEMSTLTSAASHSPFSTW